MMRLIYKMHGPIERFKKMQKHLFEHYLTLADNVDNSNETKILDRWHDS